MADYRAIARLRTLSGLPEDNLVNVWHFNTPDPSSEADAAPIALALAGFYTGLAGLMPSQTMSAVAGVHEIFTYALNEGGPGAADDSSTLLAVDSFTMGGYAAGANPPMPHEVAVCLSMGATPEAAVERIAQAPAGPAGDLRPRSSRRGRVYLGPFIATIGTTIEVVGGKVCVAPALRTTILNYAEAMVDNLVAGGVTLCVYSRKNGVLNGVTEFSVDNAFDTVRSRGTDHTVRETRVL